jgi:hypothetical protein
VALFENNVLKLKKDSFPLSKERKDQKEHHTQGDY